MKIFLLNFFIKKWKKIES